MANANQQNNPLLICDTNIVIKMSLFKHSMFEETYSFGEVEVHEIVIGEIEEWIKNPKSQKHKKFGKENLEKARDLAQPRMGSLQELPEQELHKKIHQYSSIEKKNPHNGPGKETSKPDKLILALAQKNKANIATEDRPLTSLGKRVIGNGRIFGFADMVIDLYRTERLTKEQVETGLHSLSHFRDSLSSRDNGRIFREIVDR